MNSLRVMEEASGATDVTLLDVTQACNAVHDAADWDEQAEKQAEFNACLGRFRASYEHVWHIFTNTFKQVHVIREW